MVTGEIERAYVGQGERYYVVYRHKTYEDGGETEIHSCILLPDGHPLFGVSAETKGIRSHFPLPFITAGHGSRMGIQDNSWWLVFGDLARIDEGITSLSLDDIKQRAIPQIIAELEAVESDPERFSRRRRDLEADA